MVPFRGGWHRERLGEYQIPSKSRVTDQTTAAAGDEFYPIEVIENGETGWVRDLAVDPCSFA